MNAKQLKRLIKEEISKLKRYNKRPLNEIENCDDLGNDCTVQVWVVHNTGGGANENRCGTVEQSSSGGCFCGSWGACGKVGVGGNDVLDADRTATKDIPIHGTGPTNPNSVRHRGSKISNRGRMGEIENKGWKKLIKKLGLGKAMAQCTTKCPGENSGFTGGSGCPACGAPGNAGKSSEAKKKTFSTQDDAPKSKGKAMANCTTPCPDGGFTGGSGCPACGAPGNVGKSKKSPKQVKTEQRLLNIINKLIK